MRMRAIYFIAALSCAVASVARGQSEPADTTHPAADTSLLDPRLKVGTRVRVRVSSLSPGDVVGRIREIRRDTLVIDRGGDEPLIVPAGELSRLSIGAHGATRETLAAAFGTLGFAGGPAWYFAFCAHNQSTCKRDIDEARQDTTNTYSIPSIFALYAFGTAFVSGAIGEALGVAPWEQVDKPLRVALLPTRRGIMLVASVPLGRRRRG